MIRIVTLGRFAISRDGKPLQFGRKAPLRPLALLKYLAAQGGHQFPDVQVAAALWPDKGDAALKALAVTVHRLRHLLADPAAVIHHDRRLALDSRHVWCDAYAFETFLDHGATARALALYRGDFLACEEPVAWIVPARRRLRSRFVRACADHGERLAAAQCWQDAKSCYQRGLQVDELAEDLCLGLMTCLAALHQPVDGVVAYRRFERSLAAEGAQPASATQAMYQRLLRQHR